MKYLGFSLDDIKNRLITLDTPEEVANTLAEQADIIREKAAVRPRLLGSLDVQERKES